MIEEIRLLIVVAALVLLFGKVVFELLKKNRALRKELETKEAQVATLIKYSKEISEIVEDKEGITNEIRKAKTPEEISAIINGLVAANNERVQNNSKR